MRERDYPKEDRIPWWMIFTPIQRRQCKESRARYYHDRAMLQALVASLPRKDHL